MGMDGIEKVDLLWLLGCDRSIDDVEEWFVMKNKMVVVVSLLLSILATMAFDWEEEQNAMKIVVLLMKPTLATMASASMLATKS